MLRISGILFFSFLILSSACNNSTGSTIASVLKSRFDGHYAYPILSWAGKNPAEIGCIIEKHFDYRDSIFNCDHNNYINKGDPCVLTGAYYEGIQFPSTLTSKISPLIKDIGLSFENGSLQEIFVTFKDSIAKNKLEELFQLPKDKVNLPEDIMRIDYGDNIYSSDKPIDTNYTKWLTITTIEHIGTTDMDCE
ncbi:hypothetical protein [Sphingobacterium faecium]|uniref:hypothetical protein n=1 Tax=Sphingobacterium faecium TaxID=34087 RepID=UPI00320B5209